MHDGSWSLKAFKYNAIYIASITRKGKTIAIHTNGKFYNWSSIYYTISLRVCYKRLGWESQSSLSHKWLEHRKTPSLVMTWTPGNTQCRHAPWEPHTNWDEIFISWLVDMLIIMFYAWHYKLLWYHKINDAQIFPWALY